MADNPFAKKMSKGSQSQKKGGGKEGERKAPDGESSPPPGKGQTSKGGNPFARKMDGKHPPRGRRGKRRGGRRGKLQPFQKRN